MIGERLSDLRTKKNMTQEEFAEYTNVSRQSVSKWELDKTLPDVEKLMKMSDLFEVSLDYLLKGITPNLPEQTSSECSASQQDSGVSEEITRIGEHASESEASETDPGETVQNKKSRIGITISLILTSLLLCGTLFLLAKCMLSQIWTTSDNQKELVKVEKIYSQYSLADVCSYDESGKAVSGKLLLDTNGMREGDYISCYINQDKNRIFTNYSTSTFVIIISINIVLLGIIVLLLREIKSNA